jgi:hypothetical protein
MMRQQWFPAMLLALFLALVFGAVCAAALAGTAGGGQDADAITVTRDPQLRETTYSGVSGTCRIDWIVSGSEINRGVVRQHSRCSLPLAEQIPLISAVMDRVLQDTQGAEAPRTLFWGRLYPDGQPDYVLAMRLAVAAKRSKLWDASQGRPRTGNVNLLVRLLANDALIYGELRGMFRRRRLDIQVASVEKVLISAAGQLPFFERFPKGEIKAADKLPYDCMTWFSIIAVKPK